MAPPRPGSSFDAAALDAQRKGYAHAIKVTRAELRQFNKQERERRARDRSARLLVEAQQLTRVAEEEDAWMNSVEAAPVFCPSEEEWRDPLAFIRGIQAHACEYGICVVRAPLAPTIPGGLSMLIQDPNFKFATRQQSIRDEPWDDWGSVRFFAGKRYTLKEFQDAAAAAAAKRFGGLHGSLPPRCIEREYWRERERREGPPLWVDYGSDVDGSLFLDEDRLGASRWNLNRLPREEGCALRVCGAAIPGVSRPFLYVGQLFSTFAWHAEDHFMHSINYQHLGAAKTWYGVPAAQADAFEGVARRSVYARAAAGSGGGEAAVWGAVERALMLKTTMMSPRLLVEAGVRVCRAVQLPGDFVITFPRAYHAGFGNGFQVGEAANFCLDEWWPYAEDARRRYRRLRYPAILPHEHMLCEEALALARRRAAAALEQASGPREGSLTMPASSMEAVEAAGHNALAHVFVGRMRRLHRCRHVLEEAGAVPLAACTPGSDLERASLHCRRCQQSVYLASAVPDASGPPPAWRHLCLECAVEEVQGAAGQADGAAAAAGEGRGGEAAPERQALLFVKPCWEEAERCCRQLEQSVQDPADTPLSLSLAGASEAERYGPSAEPGWPLPSQPYSWAPLRQPLDSLQRSPAAAGAPASPWASAGAPSALLSPRQLFKAEVQQQQQQQEGEGGREQGDKQAGGQAAGGGTEQQAGLLQDPRPVPSEPAGPEPPGQPSEAKVPASAVRAAAHPGAADGNGGGHQAAQMPPAKPPRPSGPSAVAGSQQRRQRRRAGLVSPQGDRPGNASAEDSRARPAAERLPSWGPPPADHQQPTHSMQGCGRAGHLAASAGSAKRQRLCCTMSSGESEDEGHGCRAQGEVALGGVPGPAPRPLASTEAALPDSAFALFQKAMAAAAAQQQLQHSGDGAAAAAFPDPQQEQQQQQLADCRGGCIFSVPTDLKSQRGPFSGVWTALNT